MKELLGAFLPALALLAVPASADAHFKVAIGGNLYLNWGCHEDCGNGNGNCGNGNGNCGNGNGYAGVEGAPWYLYWPYQAHFQTPAPVQFPYWPSPSTAATMDFGSPGIGYSSPAQSWQFQPSGFQPVGYYPQPPAYWYGR